jgi:phenylacetate-coenzyme A ligase PaaK-like adenylate-forming protein
MANIDLNTPPAEITRIDGTPLFSAEQLNTLKSSNTHHAVSQFLSMVVTPTGNIAMQRVLGVSSEKLTEMVAQTAVQSLEIEKAIEDAGYPMRGLKLAIERLRAEKSQTAAWTEQPKKAGEISR